MDEIKLLSGMGTDMPPVSERAQARTRSLLLAAATDERGSAAETPLRSAPPLSPTRAGRFRSWTRRRVRLGLVATGLALSAVIIIPLTTGTDDPAHAAYLLTKNPGGTITITINQFTDAEKLERDLRGLGVAAVVDYVPEGRRCQEPRARYLGAVVNRVVQGNAGASFTLHPEAIEAGQTLVATATFNDPANADSGSAIGFELAEGPVAPCTQLDTGLPRTGG
ncbi:hypothetical protein SAMN05444920_114106 [Nonomuraea solani]|uniref:Uncharacterized protein n=1 Tax=Nonomuraea solani TaxID=1144553 RepID=A0A1H6EPN2_9ACTN|nr:hypothetical protein [Nonomuraea solani]SEG99830.1 hypothetical protein SAMN05444920_114106 [Nonomuraea solani]